MASAAWRSVSENNGIGGKMKKQYQSAKSVMAAIMA